MSTSLTNKNEKLFDKTELNKDVRFVFDEFESFVDDLYDQTDGKKNAVLTYDKGITVLTTINFKDCTVEVYRIDESQNNDDQLGTAINALLEEHSVGDAEYLETWNSLLDALEDYKIVDETLNP